MKKFAYVKPKLMNKLEEQHESERSQSFAIHQLNDSSMKSSSKMEDKLKMMSPLMESACLAQKCSLSMTHPNGNGISEQKQNCGRRAANGCETSQRNQNQDVLMRYDYDFPRPNHNVSRIDIQQEKSKPTFVNSMRSEVDNFIATKAYTINEAGVFCGESDSHQ